MFFNPKNGFSALGKMIRVVHPGLFIPDPDPDFLPNPDPGVKKAPDPGSDRRWIPDPDPQHW
jgi:hypothetical protein